MPKSEQIEELIRVYEVSMRLNHQGSIYERLKRLLKCSSLQQKRLLNELELLEIGWGAIDSCDRTKLLDGNQLLEKESDIMNGKRT